MVTLICSKRGFSLVEVMVSVAILGGIALYSAQLMKNDPTKMMRRTQKKIEMKASIFHGLSLVTEDINHSQIYKSGLFTCDESTILDNRPKTEKNVGLIVLDDDGHQVNFVRSIYSDVVSVDRTKTNSILTASPEEFDEGDLVALTKKDNSSVGAVFFISKISDNVLTVEDAGSALSASDCDLSGAVVPFEELLEELELKLDKIEVVSYRLQLPKKVVRENHFDLLREWMNNASGNRSRIVADSVAKLSLDEYWTPYRTDIAEQNLGRMRMKIGLYYYQQKDAEPIFIESSAGFNFTASARTNFQIDVSAEPIKIISPSCMVTARVIGEGLSQTGAEYYYGKYIEVSASLSNAEDIGSYGITADLNPVLVVPTPLPGELDIYKKEPYNGGEFSSSTHHWRTKWLYANVGSQGLRTKCWKYDPSYKDENTGFIVFPSSSTYSTTSRRLEFSSSEDVYYCFYPYLPDSKYGASIDADIVYFDRYKNKLETADCSKFHIDEFVKFPSYKLSGNFQCKKDPPEILTYPKYYIEGESSTDPKFNGPTLFPRCQVTIIRSDWTAPQTPDKFYRDNCDITGITTTVSPGVTSRNQLNKVKPSYINIDPTSTYINGKECD